MLFSGISKKFSLTNEDQYNTIGKFWDDMAEIYGLENLQGLGYLWKDNCIYYAIGLKVGVIKDYNIQLELPDDNWIEVRGQTQNLKELYDEIYKKGPLMYEIETFNEEGNCVIKYYRGV